MARSFDQSEQARRGQDGGQATQGWRWFSRRTLRAATNHRDVPWSTLGTRLLVAFVLIAVSRIDPSFVLSPWILIASVVWGALTLTACGRKALDTAARR